MDLKLNRLPPRASTSVYMSPHPLFDPEYYCASNPDLQADEVSFGHYLSEGWRQGRSPHPLFSVPHYLSQRPDIAVLDIEPLTHFIKTGWKEGVDPHQHFDTKFYLSQSPVLQGADPLTHYVTVGWKMGLQPNKLFYPLWYLSTYADAATSGIESLTHFVTIGHHDGRRPSPGISTLDEEPALIARASDRRVGEGPAHYDLNKFRTVIDTVAPPTVNDLNLDRPLGIFIHLYYDTFAEEIAYYLSQLNLKMCIYITTDRK